MASHRLTDLHYGDIALMAEQEGAIATADLDAAVAMLRERLPDARVWVRLAQEVESVQNPTPTGRVLIAPGRVILEVSDIDAASAEPAMQEAARLLRVPVGIVFDREAAYTGEAKS